MKYDDDELAEAALLLAHADEGEPMPAELQRRLLAQARAVSAEVRFSTTKAASVAYEPEAPTPIRRGSALRTWGGWLAAAACFAFAVYGWRSHAMIAQDAGVRAAASEAERSSVIPVKDPAGRALAEVRWSATGGSGEVYVAALPPNASGERYQVWLSSSDAERAVPIGSFVCTDDCKGRLFAFPLPPSLASVKKVWFTRGGAPQAPGVQDGARIVGEGSHAPK